MNKLLAIKTLAQLKEAGYTPKSIKDELRDNLIKQLQSKESGFEGIIGYEDTVIPDLHTAILAKHNILLLGLRGQAKTRIARLLIGLLDEYVPYIEGSELYEDPMQPISWYGRQQLDELGDETPVAWLHRSDRYTEKLATPDVTVSDLIGDVDPIKAASMKIAYSDERVIHYGLIPRAHRGIFVINELPDLQARIQVALFNILQEKDIQIRGFKLRLPLDVQFVFTANPEDYTNRGSIVTPLKDRIESQILTHYPASLEIARQITQQEARLTEWQREHIQIDPIVKDIIEQIAFEARNSDYIDKKSGVSARLTISAFESLVSNAERRAIINGEQNTFIRLADFTGVIPAITGKIELVYEGEQEGPANVAGILVGKAIKTLLTDSFPDPERARKARNGNPYTEIIEWFASGNTVTIDDDQSFEEYKKALNAVKNLKKTVEGYHKGLHESSILLMMEFLLHGLSEFSQINKKHLSKGYAFNDMFESLFKGNFDEESEDL